MRVSNVLGFFLVEQAENPTFRADFGKNRQVESYFRGTFQEQLASQQEHRHYCSTTYGDNATHDKSAALHSYFSLFTAKVLWFRNSEQREEKSHSPVAFQS